MSGAAAMTGTQNMPPAVVANVGALYRLLEAEPSRLPESFSVDVRDDAATIQLFALGEDLPAIEAVWTLAGLLDGRDEPRAMVSDKGACHFKVTGRLGGLPVSVVTVLARPATSEAA